MKKILLICSIFLLENQLINAQLAAGDIAIIGINEDPGPVGSEDHSFTWIALTDIPAGEIIYFTEQGVNINSMTWFANTEGHYSWTSPSGGLPCGSIIHIYEDGASDVLVAQGGGTMSGLLSGSGWNLSSGDQVLVYQAASAQSAISSTTFITGIHLNDDLADGETNGWTTTSYNATGVAQCHLPPGLTDGVNCISLYSSSYPEKDNNKYIGTLTGTSTALRSLINSPFSSGNWSGDDGGPNATVGISVSDYSPSVTCVAPCTDPTVPTITASVNPVCAGSTTTLNISGTLNDATQWAVYTGSCGGTILGTTTGSTFVVTPTGPSTTYYIRGEGGCVTPGSCGTVTINVNQSSAPTISPLMGTVCPNTDVVLSASGGVVEPGSVIKWYSGPNGTGSSLGTGSSINVLPTATNTTYYVRREGVCITSDASITVNVKEYIYAPTGSTSNTYCTDNNGWHHFYNSNDKIILSVQGDISAIQAGYPIATINENTNFYQENESLTSTPADCNSGYSPQEQRFEMKRNWNVDFGGGTTNGTYNVRFYHKPEEKSDIENAAINFMSTYPSCGYSYKYNAGNLGFYWFKNSGTNYIAPQFDGIYHIAAGLGTISGINYAELQGITSFSGGSGAIILVPDASLLGTEDFENITKFSIYPNPTSGLLNINTSFDGQFIIVNQLGQIVHSFKATSNIENVINVENLTNGIYFIKEINETLINSQKLIIKK